jgi:hypothetical protein
MKRRYLLVTMGAGFFVTLLLGLGLRVWQASAVLLEPVSRLPSVTERPPRLGSEPRESGSTVARTAPALSPKPPPPARSKDDYRSLAVVGVGDIYAQNPDLIPAFAEYGAERVKSRDLWEAWKICGRQFGRRQGFDPAEPPRSIGITVVYTLKVERERAWVLGIDNQDGGDEELMRCFWRANEWLRHPFSVPGAVDGIFRWQAPYSVPWVPD